MSESTVTRIKLPNLQQLEGFKAYDVRARVPEQLDVNRAYRIGLAYANWANLRTVVVGRDIRHSSAELARALINGLNDAGVDVYDIGLCGSEQVYFATARYGHDGGVMITASHNPIEYNGMKFVGPGGEPIGLATGLRDIKAIAMAGEFTLADSAGVCHSFWCFDDYIHHVLGFINTAALRPLRVLVDPGHGGAGPVIEALVSKLGIEVVGIGMTPDGRFPLGVPNPMLQEQQVRTSEAVIKSGCDFGVSWDGDFDRCFFFDEQGRYIDPYYVVGLLSDVFLQHSPADKIVHDIRLAWNSQDMIAEAGGVSCPSASGHAFMKATMRSCDAIYGGETTGHHYFRDFYYCDSGIIPFLLMLEVLSTSERLLSAMVAERIAKYPCSGEINLRFASSTQDVIEKVRTYYQQDALQIDWLDGLSMEFAEWRFNLRASNTEPLLRLNIETRGAENLVAQKRDELLQLIGCG